MPSLLHLSRQLRSNQTEAENFLWSKIRKKQLNGMRFRRQVAIDGYIVDFLCVDYNLIIELDGGQHADQKNYDDNRTEILQSNGYLVLRYWNNEVFDNIEGVLQDIVNTVTPHPSPPLQGEGTFGIEKT